MTEEVQQDKARTALNLAIAVTALSVLTNAVQAIFGAPLSGWAESLWLIVLGVLFIVLIAARFLLLPILRRDGREPNLRL